VYWRDGNRLLGWMQHLHGVCAFGKLLQAVCNLLQGRGAGPSPSPCFASSPSPPPSPSRRRRALGPGLLAGPAHGPDDVVRRLAPGAVQHAWRSGACACGCPVRLCLMLMVNGGGLVRSLRLLGVLRPSASLCAAPVPRGLKPSRAKRLRGTGKQHRAPRGRGGWSRVARRGDGGGGGYGRLMCGFLAPPTPRQNRRPGPSLALRKSVDLADWR
jgi:hypothetical protein